MSSKVITDTSSSGGNKHCHSRLWREASASSCAEINTFLAAQRPGWRGCRQAPEQCVEGATFSSPHPTPQGLTAQHLPGGCMGGSQARGPGPAPLWGLKFPPHHAGSHTEHPPGRVCCQPHRSLTRGNKQRHVPTSRHTHTHR